MWYRDSEFCHSLYFQFGSTQEGARAKRKCSMIVNQYVGQKV